MSRVKFVTIGDKEYPVLFSQRTFIAFERITKVPLTKMSENFKSENMAILALEGLRTGFKAMKEDFKMKLDDLLDLDDEFGAVNEILTVFEDDSKKEEPISIES